MAANNDSNEAGAVEKSPNTKGCRRKVKFAGLVIVLQLAFIVIMGVFGKNPDPTDFAAKNARLSVFPALQDTNVMLVFALGFLLTFLRAYGFSAVAFNFLIAIITFQWSAIVNGVIHADVFNGGKFTYSISRMAESSFGTATILISYCVVLGKTSPTQMVVMAILEVIVAQINKYIGIHYFHVSDIGESMFIHMFAAYFGLAVSRVLDNPAVKESKKEGSSYNSDLLSFAGTLFLWLFWPSFNGGFAGDQSELAITNTFLSLAAGATVVFAVSILLDENGKFDMIHIQNATLAGGVGIGACANMPMGPFVAMTIGTITAIVCTIGFKYLTPILTTKLKIHDTCGVHNLHGIPGWISAIAAAILAATATASHWKTDISIFNEMRLENGELVGRSPALQGAYQLAAAGVTFAVAIVSGVIVGFILKLPIWDAPEDKFLFDDRDNWTVPTGFPENDMGDIQEDTRI